MRVEAFLPGQGLTVGPTLDVRLGEHVVKATVIDTTTCANGLSVTLELPEYEIQRFGSVFARP